MPGLLLKSELCQQGRRRGSATCSSLESEAVRGKTTCPPRWHLLRKSKMIEKLTDKDFSKNTMAEKVNEIIEVLNNREKVVDFEECHDFVINAASKAAKSGSHKDLQEYLKMRRMYG